ncbi:CehA/McbA family metallohydrolase, partial [Streptococcus merionis]|uniref:CehA/McbA family metallohydrolase n=1 Tax=Streptococcus merionis TaxID=400065 RepID=UPI0026EAF87A
EGHLRFQKQLGYSQSIISIGETSQLTTMGGIPGQINAGNWKLTVIFNHEYGKYLEDGKAVDFTISVDFESSAVPEAIQGPVWVDQQFNYSLLDQNKVYQHGEKWYKGDLHTHTQLSDGKELPQSVSDRAIADGLEFYVATEHNLLHTGWADTSLMVLPGIEVTTGKGHANIFGLIKRPTTLNEIIMAHSQEEITRSIEALLQECHENDWLFSINHPFLYLWKWLYDDIALENLSCLEIINDPTYETDADADGRKANQMAVALSDLLWSQGYRICAVGGSDSHMLQTESYPHSDLPSSPGDPATWLYMDSLTPANLKKALKQCRSQVTRFCQVETSFRQKDMAGKDLGPLFYGDCIDDTCTNITFELLFSMDHDPLVFYIINTEKVILATEQIRLGLYRVNGTIALNSDEYQWIRFGATTSEGDFRFYANPITKGRRSPELRTFGEVRRALEGAL